jgi:DNA adenine methylase
LTSRAASPDSSILDPNDFTYPGSKGQSGVWQWIIERLPPHVYYAEPFAGKGGVFRHKSPALRTWLIDRDPDVVTWWTRQFGCGSIDISIKNRTWFREQLSSLDRSGDDGHRASFRAVHAVQGNGIEFVEAFARSKIRDLLLYVDPPYLARTRVKKKLYRYEMTDLQHFRLLEAACKCVGPVVISGYRSDLYRTYLQGWKLDTTQVMTRGGTFRTECLWRNEAATAATPVLAVEYSRFASTWRERERVHKLIERWKSNFRKRPANERRALLLALMDEERNSRE